MEQAHAKAKVIMVFNLRQNNGVLGGSCFETLRDNAKLPASY
jgi:hypothetical protein